MLCNHCHYLAPELFSSCKTEMQYPLNNNSVFLSSSRTWQLPLSISLSALSTSEKWNQTVFVILQLAGLIHCPQDSSMLWDMTELSKYFLKSVWNTKLRMNFLLLLYTHFIWTFTWQNNYSLNMANLFVIFIWIFSLTSNLLHCPD